MTIRDRLAVFLGELICCFLASLAWADGTLPSYYQDPGLNPNRTTVNHNLDEYIDPFTGMLQLHHVDMVWPGNAGFDLVLGRSFNNPGPLFGSASDTQSYSHTPNIGVGCKVSFRQQEYPAGIYCGFRSFSRSRTRTRADQRVPALKVTARTEDASE